MRHGQAQIHGNSDAQRPLTEQGKLEACLMAKWLQQNQAELEHVYVSPYLRAQQTCDAVLAQLDASPIKHTLNMITPEGSAQEFHDYLDGVCSVEKMNNILVVSHMPLVSFLVEELTIEQNAPIFQTAAIAHIDYDLKRMKGQLVQLIAPDDIC